jgi:hypothetical protein
MEYRTGCIVSHVEAASNGNWVYHHDTPIVSSIPIDDAWRAVRGPGMWLHFRVEPSMLVHMLPRWKPIYSHGYAGAYDYTFTNKIVTDTICFSCILTVRSQLGQNNNMFDVSLEVKGATDCHDYVISGFRSASFEYMESNNTIRWTKSPGSDSSTTQLTLHPPLSTFDKRKTFEDGGEMVHYDDAVISYDNGINPRAYKVRINIAIILGVKVDHHTSML